MVLPYAMPIPSLISPLTCQGIFALSTLVIVLTIWRILRKRWYEIHLRTHQALAIFSAYAVGRHTYVNTTWLREYLFWCSGACAAVLAVPRVQLVYYNDMPYKLSTVLIYADPETQNCVLIMKVPRQLKWQVGQYLNIMIPGVSGWAALQSHPFVIASYATTSQSYVKFFVASHTGFTKDLLKKPHNSLPSNDPLVLQGQGLTGTNLEKTLEQNNILRLAVTSSDPVKERDTELVYGNHRPLRAVFSGPHGVSAPVDNFSTVLMFASDFGFAAHVPYITKLLREYQGSGRGTRVHLVWDVEHRGSIMLRSPVLIPLTATDSYFIFHELLVWLVGLSGQGRPVVPSYTLIRSPPAILT
jgi:hypothetical protein